MITNRFLRVRLGIGFITVVLLAGISAIAVSSEPFANSDALWGIVHGRCLPNMLTKHNPAPCVSVNVVPGSTDGFAILKDATGNSQYLIIPTAKITGIESPA